MEKLLTRLTSGYESMLTWLVSTGYDRQHQQSGLGSTLKRFFLNARWLVVAVMLVSAGAIAWVLPGMKRELSPLEDRGQVLAVIT
eukprot:gene491-620_t